MNLKIKIAILDDHVGIREGFRAILNRIPYVDQVAAYGTGKELFEGIKRIKFNLILIDIRLKNENGFDICKKIKQGNNPPKVLIISSFHNEAFIINAYNIDADGFLFKDADLVEIRKAIDQVLLDDKAYYDNEGLSAIVNHHKQINERAKNSKIHLSPIELKVAKLICEGKTTKEAAMVLSLEATTVNTHRHRIWKKLGIHKSSELINYMISHGFYQPSDSFEN
jgi:DNA-binding NarL/FixJ family response regulator